MIFLDQNLLLTGFMTMLGVLLGVSVNRQKICVLLRRCCVLMMRFGWQKTGALFNWVSRKTKRMTISSAVPVDTARFHSFSGRAQIGERGITALPSGKITGIHLIGRPSQVLAACKKGKCC